MNIPTRITTARIVAIVLMLIGMFVSDFFIPELSFLYVSCGSFNIYIINLVWCGIFIIASITDFLDGYLARKWNQVTDLGKFLDPIADKLLVDCTFIYLCISRFPGQLCVNLYLVIILIARDLIIDALRQVSAAKGKVLAANMAGKLKTVFEMIAIPLVLLNGFPFAFLDHSWPAGLHITDFIVYITTIASVVSGALYIFMNLHVFKEDK
ncbi:MAG: CDP-diacylglycerol--glycerol-3-phosphate 3-phosphatidyltransferase [Bacilli bacterium]|nr:CDP-diacylglycerol--glycerol-3-phosphate 3-phosphatidyltransferase [Bacilli bacterium]